MLLNFLANLPIPILCDLGPVTLLANRIRLCLEGVGGQVSRSRLLEYKDSRPAICT